VEEGRWHAGRVADRCCHRTAKLSKGFVEDGNIVCGYHGWTYDCSGACVQHPAAAGPADPGRRKVPAYHCAERFGYAWVALDDPLMPLLDRGREALG
jgi:phenylpropionate dioxygenase-like ring-hydroxylating dioxygenase large terminal subunit